MFLETVRAEYQRNLSSTNTTQNSSKVAAQIPMFRIQRIMSNAVAPCGYFEKKYSLSKYKAAIQ